MSLPDAWVNKIFEELTLVYGHAFLRRWDGLDMVRVKAKWAEELAPFAAAPAALRHALERLPPDLPPTVLQFRDLCLSAPRQPTPTLPLPDADPQRVVQTLAQLQQQRAVGPRDLKAWARELKAREERGERLTQAQREMSRAALRTAYIVDNEAEAAL